MPEVMTKHPDVVREVLQSAGARCGAGAPQKILTKCPPAQFCAVPGGEICIYGAKDLRHMTQLSREDVCEIRADAVPPTRAPLAASVAEWGLAALLPGAIAGALLIVRLRR